MYASLHRVAARFSVCTRALQLAEEQANTGISADAAHAYYNSYTKRMDKLAGYNTNQNMTLVSYFMCAETDEEA